MPRTATPGRFGIQPVKKMLADQGITHEAAAEELVRSAQAVTMIVNGHSRPSIDNAALLARLVGRPIEECFNDKVLGYNEWRVRRRRIGSER